MSNHPSSGRPYGNSTTETTPPATAAPRPAPASTPGLNAQGGDVGPLPPATGPARPRDYVLVFEDTFDRGDRPDPAHWRFEYGFLRNREAQFYTDRPENVRIENGVLVIEARRERFPTGRTDADGKPAFAEYTSGSIETRHAWTYGFIEVRAKIPSGRGTWPAIWTLGSNIREVGWPACGEIDIMEHVGHDPNRLHGTIHTAAYNHAKGTQRGASFPIDQPHTDFHVYAVHWTPDGITFFFNDTPYFHFPNERKTEAEWPFDKPQYLKLNLAIGGVWGGQKGIDDTAFPHRFEIDYVRVYQAPPAPRDPAPDDRVPDRPDRP
ncbi:MAG: family 16 glycosylhydrolase [Tepidisphaerales bacterium]